MTGAAGQTAPVGDNSRRAKVQQLGRRLQLALLATTVLLWLAAIIVGGAR